VFKSQSLLLEGLHFAHGIFSCLLKVSIQSLLLEGHDGRLCRKNASLSQSLLLEGYDQIVIRHGATFFCFNSVPPARRITTATANSSLITLATVSTQSLLLEGLRRQLVEGDGSAFGKFHQSLLLEGLRPGRYQTTNSMASCFTQSLLLEGLRHRPFADCSLRVSIQSLLLEGLRRLSATSAVYQSFTQSLC